MADVSEMLMLVGILLPLAWARTHHAAEAGYCHVQLPVRHYVYVCEELWRTDEGVVEVVK